MERTHFEQIVNQNRQLERIANALDKANMIAAITLRKAWGVDINQKPGHGPHPG